MSSSKALSGAALGSVGLLRRVGDRSTEDRRADVLTLLSSLDVKMKRQETSCGLMCRKFVFYLRYEAKLLFFTAFVLLLSHNLNANVIRLR